jgi:hypothetical protein
MATDGQIRLFSSYFGFEDGSFWKKSIREKAQVKTFLTLCTKWLAPEYANLAKRKLAEIKEHDAVRLHPRDRVIVICNDCFAKVGTTGTLVKIESDKRYGELRIDRKPKPLVRILLSYLDPIGPHPGPEDIYHLTPFEQTVVFRLKTEFFSERTSELYVYGILREAEQYGLLEPLFLSLFTENAGETPVKLLGLASTLSFNDFGNAYIDANVRFVQQETNK